MSEASGIAVRAARPADADAVAALIDAAFVHYVPILGRKPRPMLDDHAARIARGETFVADDGARLLGVISISPNEGALHIFNIAVRPEAQGSGLLRRLIAFAEARARQNGAGRLTLYTNVAMTRNRSIDAHLGFTEDGISEGGGYKIVHMTKPLGEA